MNRGLLSEFCSGMGILRTVVIPYEIQFCYVCLKIYICFKAPPSISPKIAKCTEHLFCFYLPTSFALNLPASYITV